MHEWKAHVRANALLERDRGSERNTCRVGLDQTYEKNRNWFFLTVEEKYPNSFSEHYINEFWEFEFAINVASCVMFGRTLLQTETYLSRATNARETLISLLLVHDFLPKESTSGKFS